MTLLYADPRFFAHETGRHPERAERLIQVYRHLERVGLDVRCRRAAWQPATREQLLGVHEANHLDQLEALAGRGGGRLDADTLMSPASFDVARLAAGAVCDAVTRVVAGEDSQALCLVRPPGHHALADTAMGFCLLNNVAVAARLAIDRLGLNRVMIIDWDVHHGNGTQALFWEDSQVSYLSIHRWPFYPGTGWSDETGSGRGLGATLNLPVEMGIRRHDYYRLLADEAGAFADRHRPELLLVSAGFDSHVQDPIGSLGLETEDFGPLTETALEIAAVHSGGRLVSVLEGGYNTGVLAGCVELHLATLLQRQGRV